jgi:hypothetical protein
MFRAWAVLSLPLDGPRVFALSMTVVSMDVELVRVASAIVSHYPANSQDRNAICSIGSAPTSRCAKQ